MTDLPSILPPIFLPDEAASLRFGHWLAMRLQAGDIISLEGDLGAGKTSMARGIIQSLCGMDTIVPSPTFTLVQHYQSARFEICHADLYRLENPNEMDELDLFDDNRRLVLLEWATRLEDRQPDMARLCLSEENKGRWLHFEGKQDILERLQDMPEFVAREEAMLGFVSGFLEKNNLQNVSRVPIAGDASARRYERLSAEGPGEGQAEILLMDWPQVPINAEDDAQDYAAKVKLGRTLADFTHIADYLRSVGLSAPACLATDPENGFMLVEDFGSLSMTKMIDTQDARLDIFYHEAVAGLIRLAKQPPPSDCDAYDAEIWQTELDVFVDWYVPYIGAKLSADAHNEWQNIWHDSFAVLNQQPSLPDVLVLRDYHSPNLHWIEKRQAASRVGIIDVQDGLVGSPVYDLVSLLQDARRDVPKERAERLLTFYLSQTGFDRQAVEAAYAIFGAQRNLRIAGVFARLAVRDNRPDYLQHMPRVLAYIAQNCQHVSLKPLRSWLKKYLPDKGAQKW